MLCYAALAVLYWGLEPGLSPRAAGRSEGTLVCLVVPHSQKLYRRHLSQAMFHPWVETKCHFQVTRRNKKANPNPSTLTFLQHPHLSVCSSWRKAGSATGIQAKGHLQGCGKGRQMGCLTVKVPCYDSTQPFHPDSHRYQMLRWSYSQRKGSYSACWKIFVILFSHSVCTKSNVMGEIHSCRLPTLQTTAMQQRPK